MGNQVRKKQLKEVEAFLNDWSLVIDSRLRFDLLEIGEGRSKYVFNYYVLDKSLRKDTIVKLKQEVINDYIHEVTKTYNITLKLNEKEMRLEVE